jgi:predicted DNA-binding protein
LLADKEVAKTSLRLPKILMKRMKLYAIESEKSVTEIVIEACDEYLNNRKH